MNPKISSGASSACRELYREYCQDEGGTEYTVIVYRPFPI